MQPAISAGSMADIAFLLLLFFLVSTTILQEEGILVRLPTWAPEEAITPLAEDAVLTVALNAKDELLLERESLRIEDIPARLKAYLLAASSRPKIVSFTHDRATTYSVYVAVYDALLAGYRSARDEVAKSRYGLPYTTLSKEKQAQIRAIVPMIISESEPSDYAAI